MLAAPFASDGLRGGETVELNAPAGIKNRLNRYGNYCGPGPDDASSDDDDSSGDGASKDSSSGYKYSSHKYGGWSGW